MEAGFPYWVWLVLGLVLCAAETLAPGAFLIWIGAAALILGAVDFYLPLPFTEQMLGFAALLIVLVYVGRRVYGSIGASARPLAESRAHALIGREFTLEQGVEQGFGVIRVDDSIWRVVGDADLPKGAKVRVVAVDDGARLRVEKV
jgi:membrane protein implicated in regulation of membrane protease activity